MKKQFAVFSFVFLLAFGPISSFARNEGFILDRVLNGIQVNPTAYMNAQTVLVKVLDANGNILASGQVAPGGNLSFPLTGNERQVQEIYHINTGAFFIIISEIPPL